MNWIGYIGMALGVLCGVLIAHYVLVPMVIGAIG